MKILLVGEYAWPWYQAACADALESLGCTVIRFGWLERFKKFVPGRTEPVYRSGYHRLQYRFLVGPTVSRLNRDLLKVVEVERPDVIWFYSSQMITARTVAKIRKRLPNTILAQYANDNPFAAANQNGMWRHYLAAVPLMDVHFVFRHQNLQDVAERSSAPAHLLRAYFLPEVDRPLPESSIPERFRSDVVFAGHYEADGRLEALETIVRAGFRLTLFGGGWNAALPKLAPDSPLRGLFPVAPVTGDDYVAAICGARVALCFLSRINQDTYTRRNFQIPAMRVAMLSERTPDLESLFVPDEEAAFFGSTDELLEKLRWLVGDDAARKRVADGGYDRAYRDRHHVVGRMEDFLMAVRQAGK